MLIAKITFDRCIYVRILVARCVIDLPLSKGATDKVQRNWIDAAIDEA